MKRFFIGMGVVAALLFGVFIQTASARDVNDFIVNSFDAEYYLTRDTEGRSVLRTKETITATFPQADQNHGLERAIPSVYDGHSTRLSIDSVKDGSGRDLAYDQSGSNDNEVLRIGDADTYVHGLQTYVIEYTQHDVTRYFSDTSADELYWDVNGTQWSQRMERVSAKITVDDSLKESLTNKATCYQGYTGATESCERAITDGEWLFRSSRTLLPGENLTFAIGFSGQTFAVYQQTAEEKIWAFLAHAWLSLLVLTSILAIGIGTWMGVIWTRTMNARKGRGPIAVEYLPPKATSVLVSAQILHVPTATLTAQLLDLAVRHYVKIYQTKEKKIVQSAEYELEVIRDTTDLSDEEQSLVKALFGKKHPDVGARFAMKTLRSNYTVGRQLSKDSTKLRNKMRGDYGYYKKATQQAKRLNGISTVLLITGIVTLSPLALIVAVVGYVWAYSLWPLTTKGHELDDYLAGLKVYIKAAEKDRLAMLQSPEGAEKVGDITGDKGALIKLYERVLPYAVLYGFEKEWMGQLGAYYDESSAQPDWYGGMNGAAFNAALFSASIGSFSDQSTTYSSSSSSGYGGSDGGGSSGAGGGGGGGGGW